eukprot:49046_1
MASNVKTILQRIRSSTIRPKLSISFHPESRLRLVEVTTSFADEDNDQEKAFVPVYSNGSDICGAVDIHLPDNVMTFEYDEIVLYLVGHVVCPDEDRDSVFLSRKITMVRHQGTFTENASFDFKFTNVPLTRDSYYGSLFKCRYFLRAVISRSKLFQSNIKIDQDFVVMNVQHIAPPKPVTMQVGVDECLHIKFKYDNVHLSVDGCLAGDVKVLSNTLKITTMQIQLIRREMINALRDNRPEIISTTVLGKFEIMDGYPGDGEQIPIRMFLGKFKHITNTQIQENFSIRYYVNLGLIDKDGRRYFKTCELTLFRDKI